MSNTFRKADIWFCHRCNLPLNKHTVEYCGQKCQCNRDIYTISFVHTDGTREQKDTWLWPDHYTKTDVDVYDSFTTMWSPGLSSWGHNPRKHAQQTRNRAFRHETKQKLHQITKEYNSTGMYCDCVDMHGFECTSCQIKHQNHKSTQLPIYKKQVDWDIT